MAAASLHSPHRRIGPIAPLLASRTAFFRAVGDQSARGLGPVSYTHLDVYKRQVQKSYDGVSLVVKDLNLSIGKGEFLTMLGPSGSGKTTCLMMLAGFETATHGRIMLDGTNINEVPPHKRGIGMVFQNYALFPHMTVGENLAFPLEVRGMAKSDREAKVKRALDMVQMYSFINRRPAQLLSLIHI